MSKLCFVERVKARIKGGEDASIMRLQIETDKYLSKQIKLIEERIEDNTVEIEEKETELEQYLESPDLDRIAKVEVRKEYIKNSYVAGYDRIVKAIDVLKEKIEEDTKLMAKRKAMINHLNDGVEVKK